MSDFILIPQRDYNVIYADPPWRYADKGCNGNAADHYPKRVSNAVSQLVVSSLRDRIVELMGRDTPRIELFARETAPGWDCWGNEVPIISGGGTVHD